MTENANDTMQVETVSAINSKSGRTQTLAIALVLCCAILACGAQILLKHGANELSLARMMAGKLPLAVFLGYGLYGISAVLLILALKRGELSILYPILATTYIWIVLLSPIFFPTDNWTRAKFVGVFLISAGVWMIGRTTGK